MAHDAVMLDIAVNPLALFHSRDPDALAFLSWLVEQVANTRREENARQKAEMDRARAGR